MFFLSRDSNRGSFSSEALTIPTALSGIVIVAIRLSVEIMSDDFSMCQMCAETNTIFRTVNKAAVVMLVELEDWTFILHQIFLINSALT
jgi:hypothetical protein